MKIPFRPAGCGKRRNFLVPLSSHFQYLGVPWLSLAKRLIFDRDENERFKYALKPCLPLGTALGIRSVQQSVKSPVAMVSPKMKDREIPDSNVFPPEVDVTFDREAFAPTAQAGVVSHWNVAVVRVRCEKLAVDHIKKLGMEAFVPTQMETHQWKDRRKKIERIITPSLVFFNISQSLCHSSVSAEGVKRPKTRDFLEKELRARQLDVRKTMYVYRLLSMPHETKPADIPEEQLRRFKYMIGMSDERVDLVPTFAKGDHVRVVRGSLKGFEGYIAAEPDGKQQIGVLVEPLGYAVTGISLNDVESI